MSTFGGKFKEIPHISVDNFTGDNENSHVFFLSHCHLDHMNGLNSWIFQDILLKENLLLYASAISCEILQGMHPRIASQLRQLDMQSMTEIQLNDKSKSIICVTPISAGHCPGSVMFLFESESHTILYTGDYRIEPKHLKQIKFFYDPLQRIKTIDVLYLDTTFFLTKFRSFPTRQDSLNELIRLIEEWTTQGEDYVIKLITRAKYGYEGVFIDLYKHFKKPIHVNKEVYDLYKLVPEMDKAVSLTSENSQIHCACGKPYTIICCEYSKELKVRNIQLSAYRWSHEDFADGISNVRKNIHYVCFSTHASYEEGVELIKFLKPKKIVPCVVPEKIDTKLEMDRLLVQQINDLSRDLSIDEKVEESSRPALFKTDFENGVRNYSMGSSTIEKVVDPAGAAASGFQDVAYNILNSPPRL